MPPHAEFEGPIGRFLESQGQRALAGLTLLTPDAWSADTTQGLVLTTDAEPEARFTSAPIICIDFASFHDGRGLSLAVMLRTRMGYTGELRAIGDVRPDLLHYLMRCGFDSFVLADGCHIDPNDPRLAPHAAHYQASVQNPLPVFRRDVSKA
jgi:uncharacterized protein (DUF934 family)